MSSTTRSQLSGCSPEEGHHISACMIGVVVPDLVGDHLSGGADGTQQRAGEAPIRPASNTQSVPREDVTLVNDLCGIFGIDDLGAAGHRHDDVVDQQRTQYQEGRRW